MMTISPELGVLYNSSVEIRVVLVRTRNPLHIGAAARAMANFGIQDLTVVRPYDRAWKEARSAVGAAHILRGARQASLADAVRDCHLVLGTTTGKKRSLFQPLIPLPELNVHIKERMPSGGGRVAILFGSEKTGLTNRDFEQCHALVRIPTRPETPSMNLGQAIAIVLYELARTGAIPSPRTLPKGRGFEFLPSPLGGEGRVRGLPFALPTQEQIEDLVERTRRVLERIDYMQHMPVDTQLEKLRRAFKHWHMTRADAALLQAIFKRVAELPRFPSPAMLEREKMGKFWRESGS